MIWSFGFCESLKSLNLSNFNTSNLNDMQAMFYDCKNLELIDISNFDTSNVKHMDGLFGSCKSIKSINLSHFNTSSLISISEMFSNCKNLELIDISNFDTSKVIYMQKMFTNCESLKALNLSHFNISSVTNMEHMFENCTHLEFLNMKSAIEYDNIILTHIFDNIPENIVYCINEINAPKINSILKNKSCSINYCLDNWKEKQNIITYVDNKIICDFSEQTSNYMSSIISINDTSIEIDNFTNYYCNEIDFFANKCNDCKININYINDNLNSYTISQYIYRFINDTFDNIYKLPVNHYINNNLKFTITIFNAWYCTNLLLKYGYFEINPSLIYNEINSNLNLQKNYIFVYINGNNKNYIEIYDESGKNRQDVNLICPNCLEENNLIIKNNFTKKIYSEIGRDIAYKIIDNNIDPFNAEDPIFNDICKNYTIKEIDIPINERRLLIFLGYKEKEIICNDINCNIENYYLTNLTSICKCKISINSYDYLLSNGHKETNKNRYTEYINLKNSKYSTNSFLIFKCGKEAFILNNIKTNPGFYIGIVFLTIQIILYGILIFHYFKKTDTVKLNPPKIQKFEINDNDSEENEDNNSKKLSEDKKSSNKMDKIIEYKNTDLNLLKEDKNENQEESANNNNLAKQDKLNLHKLNINMIEETIYNEKKTIESHKNNCFSSQNEQSTILNNYNNLQNINTKKKKRSLKNLAPIQRNMISSQDLFNKHTTKDITHESVEIPSLLPSKSLMTYYWEYLSLEQPIINLLESIKYLKIETSYIPFEVKLMKIIFNLYLNIFFNIIHLGQNYFGKKFDYFNNKYNIINNLSDNNISLNERFKYGFNYTAISGIISFLICFVIQCTLNYFYFDIRKIINKNNISKRERKNNKIDNISNNSNLIMLKNKNKSYLVFFGVVFIIIIFISYFLITFNQVYRGGISDLIAGVFWTFFFLQIIPFFYCFILCFKKYKKK